MDFEMTHEQALIVEQVRRFVREEIVPLDVGTRNSERLDARFMTPFDAH